MRWFNNEWELLEYLGNDKGDRELIKKLLDKQIIMVEDGKYCFVRDYDNEIYRNEIKALKNELAINEKLVADYADAINKIHEILKEKYTFYDELD